MVYSYSGLNVRMLKSRHGCILVPLVKLLNVIPSNLSGLFEFRNSEQTG